MQAEELRFPFLRAYRRQLIMSIVPFCILAALFRRPLRFAERYDLLLNGAGLVLAGIGVLIRLVAANEICDRKKVALVTTGIYSSVRNPLYLGNFIAGLGISLVAGSLTIAMLVFIVYLPVYMGVILHEERRLRGIHGRPFDDYMESVPRFFPRFSFLTKGTTRSWDRRLVKRELPNMIGVVVSALVLEGLEKVHEVYRLASIFP